MVTPGIAHNPIRQIIAILVLVHTPTNNDNRVVQRLMRHLKLTFTILVCVFCAKCLRSGCLVRGCSCITGVGGIDPSFYLLSSGGVNGQQIVGVSLLSLYMILYHRSVPVRVEIFLNQHFSCERSVHHEFFSDLDLGRADVVAVDVFGIEDPCLRLTVRIITASVALGNCLVWCTLVRWNATVHGKEGIENCPTTLAALRHIIALDNELYGEIRLVDVFVSVLDFHAGFRYLDESKRIARAALGLVTEVSGEVVSANVSPIELIGHLMVRDFIRSSILFHEALSFIRCHFEIIGLFSELFLS